MQLKCKTCNFEGHCDLFVKNKSIARGYTLRCIKCKNEKQRADLKLNNNSDSKKYEKTLRGHIMRTYRNMLSRVTGVQKKKSHLYEGLPILSKIDFQNWAISNRELKNLYNNWVSRNYDRRLTPSIDRIDSSDGYVFGNIRWLTHSENSSLGGKNK